MSEHFCAHCGAEYRPGKRSCPHCGASESDGWADEESAEGWAEDSNDDFDYDEYIESEFGKQGSSVHHRPLTRRQYWSRVSQFIIWLVIVGLLLTAFLPLL